MSPMRRPSLFLIIRNLVIRDFKIFKGGLILKIKMADETEGFYLQRLLELFRRTKEKFLT